jgi:mannose-6-phosphate isomerase-like protein (cupin superfamily)
VPAQTAKILVKHANAVDNGKRIELPAETVYELGRGIGKIRPGKKGVGIAFARISSSEPHYHKKTIEYYFVTKGKGRLDLDDGKIINLRPNDVLVIPPGVTHAVNSPEGIEVFVLSSPPWTKDDHIPRDLRKLRR